MLDQTERRLINSQGPVRETRLSQERSKRSVNRATDQGMRFLNRDRMEFLDPRHCHACPLQFAARAEQDRSASGQQQAPVENGALATDDLPSDSGEVAN